MFSPLHTKEFWDKLEPLEGSQKYLKQLKSDGHHVYLLTSAHPNTIPYKFAFLNKYFSFIPFRDVIITAHKQMVKGDVLIDDAPHNLEGGDYQGLLMNSPHNLSYDESVYGFIRVNNWGEIYETINRIAGKE